MRWTRKAPVHRLTDEQERELTRCSRRVGMMSDHELLETADAYGTGMATGLYDFRKHGERESIDEVLRGFIALQAIVLELALRAEARSA